MELHNLSCAFSIKADQKVGPLEKRSAGSRSQKYQEGIFARQPWSFSGRVLDRSPKQKKKPALSELAYFALAINC